MQINDNKSDFFPKEKALCLGGEEDQADAQLEQIQEMIEDLLLRYRKKVSAHGSVTACVALSDIVCSASCRM